MNLLSVELRVVWSILAFKDQKNIYSKYFSSSSFLDDHESQIEFEIHGFSANVWKILVNWSTFSKDDRWNNTIWQMRSKTLFPLGFVS